jgi:hypothetical protein
MVKRFFQVVDGFYPNPDRVRQLALELPYTEPEELTGWRSKAYQPRGIRELIERKFRLRISYWEDDLTAIEACNGVFFRSCSKGRYKESVGIHYDEPVTWMMFLVYLTPNAAHDAGTSLWQHRRTALIAKPTPGDEQRLGIGLKELRQILERDAYNPKRWKEIDRVGNVYNRAVMFPSGLLHSASKHFGSHPMAGRLYQSFHFPIAP